MWRSKICIVFILIAICFGQEQDANARVAHLLISHILLQARVSGSLEYSGTCDTQQPQPHIRNVRVTLDNWGAPVTKTLGEMFASDHKMHVTQERDGIVRMVESDIAQDLLSVKINHIVFHDSRDRGEALEAILHAPEVQAFMSEHKIMMAGTGQETSRKRVPSSLPPMSGQLDNVSLSQALDYVLTAYPGYWVYENCPTTDRGRSVFFQFF